MFDKVKFGHFPVLFCGVGFYSSASCLGTFPAREGRRIPKQFRFLHSYYSRAALLKRSFQCVAPLQNAVLPLRSPSSLTFPISHFPFPCVKGVSLFCPMSTAANVPYAAPFPNPSHFPFPSRSVRYPFSIFNYISAPLASSLAPRPRALVPLSTATCNLKKIVDFILPICYNRYQNETSS